MGNPAQSLFSSPGYGTDRSSPVAAGSVFVPPAYTGYGSDGYSDVINRVVGILTLYDFALTQIEQAVLSTNTKAASRPENRYTRTGAGILYVPPQSPDMEPCRKEENGHAAEIDGYDKKLLDLTQQLQKLRLQGKKPDQSTWGSTQDSLITKCDFVFRRCQSYAADPNFNNPSRIVAWHFRGPLEVLSGLKKELLTCSQAFSMTSTRVELGTGAANPYFTYDS